MMRFDKKLTDYMTFQRSSDGYADITLSGSNEETLEGLPWLRVTEELTGNLTYAVTLPPAPTWKTALHLPAGLYRIECGTLLDSTGRNPKYPGCGQVLRHIGVGEVFAIAGQSNAAGYGLQNISDSKDIPAVGIAMKNDLGWQLAAHPIGQMDGEVPCADSLHCGHSPWLRFARYISDGGIPAGLVPAARSGTSISQWQSGGSLYSYLTAQLEETGAGNLIWMQGCSDVHAGSFESYFSLFGAFLSAIKKSFPGLDITIIQISGTEKEESYIGWKTVRNAQRLLADKYGCHLVPSYDLSEYSDDIHLSGKSNLRLASRVFEVLQGNEAPVPVGFLRKDDRVAVKMSKPIEAGPMPVLLDASYRKIEAAVYSEGDIIMLVPIESIPRFVTLDAGVLYRPCAEALPMPCLDFFVDLYSL